MKYNIFLFVLLLVSIDTSIAFAGSPERKATELEFTYTYLASDIKMPEVCEKIFDGAYIAAGWGGEGHQIAYTKSECYLNTAITTQNPELCKKVIPKNTLFLNGNKLTESECRNEVAKAHGNLRSHGGNTDLLMHLLNYGVDYDKKRLAEFYASHPKARLNEPYRYEGVELYWKLRGTDEFRKRIARLPDFSKENVFPADFSFTEISCKDENDPRWFCMHARCLKEAKDNEYREACSEIAKEVEVAPWIPENNIPRTAEILAKNDYQKRQIFQKYPELKKRYDDGIAAYLNETRNKPEH